MTELVSTTRSLGEQIFEAERKPWIAIIGFADSKKHFPFDDERWWTWGVNDLYNYVPRVDVSFELHHTLNMGARRNPEDEKVRREGGRRGMACQPGKPSTPIFMQEANPDYPTVMAFPKERIISAFGTKNYEPMPGETAAAPGASYFTNSIGWMIALAILELTFEQTQEVRNEETGELIASKPIRVARPDARLAIYGVSMAADSEYVAQRPNVEFWVGMARSCGIEVSVPDDSHILKAATLYGYSSSHPLRVRLQADRQGLSEKTVQLMQQEAALMQQLEQVRHTLSAIRGQKEYIAGLERTLVIGTEIGIGSDDQGPNVGRAPIIQTSTGSIEQVHIQPSDNQVAQSAGVN